MAEAKPSAGDEEEPDAEAWDDWLLLQAEALEGELEAAFDLSGPQIGDALAGFLSANTEALQELGQHVTGPATEQLRALLEGPAPAAPDLVGSLQSLAQIAAELEPWEVEALLEAAEDADSREAGPTTGAPRDQRA